MIIVGILGAAVLHGTYDGLTGLQMTMAAVGFSFVLTATSPNSVA